MIYTNILYIDIKKYFLVIYTKIKFKTENMSCLIVVYIKTNLNNYYVDKDETLSIIYLNLYPTLCNKNYDR